MDVSGRTARQAAPYAFEGKGEPDICIRLNPADMLAKNPGLGTTELAEYLGTGAVFAQYLLDYDGLYIHSSAVALNGKAYLFSAPSGTGKSTHTEKWCRLFGARYINDDKPVLRLLNGSWMAYGTPWSGKNDLSSPEGVPVGSVVVLQRGDKNEICRISAADALPLIMSQSLWRLQQDRMEKQLSLLDAFLKQVPVFLLTCRNEDAAAYVSMAAMTAEVQD